MKNLSNNSALNIYMSEMSTWEGIKMELIGLSLSIFFIILLLIFSGYPSFTPIVIIVGAAIGGAFTQEERDGAVVGIFIAVSVPIIIGVIVLVFGTFATFQQLFVPPPLVEEGGNVLSLVIVMIIVIMFLSAIVGAAGGFVGRALFKDREGRILSGFGGLTRIPPPVKDTLVCLTCGTPNAPRAQFCSKCGTKMHD